MDNKIICTCMEVTCGQIIKAIKDKGCKTFEDVQNQTEAGTVCGCCEDDIQEILNEYVSK